ncbi:DUF1573 domain-containing protein [Sphingobacterium corticibacter]|uniref:DUF1573 domain-containing protein n=1 Tax=Sphingobacterium corticibacter TaxID=2171749 RepID=A0A2T8HGP6_9SPHI|nr:DUF1573 domain-containing protein [Sphingobacterium corticibacter]PVH24618.1 hypothetical protein DC487_13885 [Sphingobacterium corticibacter]
MKYINNLSAALSLLLLVACNNAGNTSNTSATDSTSSSTEVAKANTGNGEVSFAEEAFDFGQITDGEVVDHTFKFKNTGTEPVIISRVSTSCGCTTPEYTSTPVAPNGEGEVKVRFDSHGQSGKQQKIITVVSNAKNNIQTIQLKGEVS